MKMLLKEKTHNSDLKLYSAEDRLIGVQIWTKYGMI